MKVLVACEYSGIVRDAFIDAGHEAISCDLLPSESDKGEHWQGDIREFLPKTDWDLIVAHPPCTTLANSGVRWMDVQNGTPTNYLRYREMVDACELFNLFFGYADKVCIENPIQHKYARMLIRKQDQVVQPWMFGHGEQKAVCLWQKGLPLLEPTDIVEGREQKVWKMAPGENRQKERSRFYTGIAKAMAEQWGSYKPAS